MSQRNPPPEASMPRAERTRNKIHNERMKLLSSLFHGLALATFGLGALRLILDPGAQPPGQGTIALALAAALFAEVVAFYILGRSRAEN